MCKDILLSDKLKDWHADRPDEWTMDEFIRDAIRLEGLVTGYLTELSNLHDEVDRLKAYNDMLFDRLKAYNDMLDVKQSE